MTKLILAHNINKFYHTFADVIGVAHSHTKLRDLKDTDYLLGVEFDILKVIEAYDDDQFGMSRWLKKLYEQIETVREAHKPKYKTLIALILAIAIGFIIGRAYTIRQAELLKTTDTEYFINFGNEIHQYTYEEVNK